MIRYEEFGVQPQELARKLASYLVQPDQTERPFLHASQLLRSGELTEGETAYLVAVASATLLKAGKA